MTFEPNYKNILDAANNLEAKRLPLYEHIVSYEKIGELIGKDMLSLYQGDEADINEFFRLYCNFFKEHGYDVVPFEECIGSIMPGSGALGDSRVIPVIQTKEDFDAYPWEAVPDYYFEKNRKYFTALRKNMPDGMRAIGGVGNGIFECVQEVVGYQNLCYLSVDDDDFYAKLFRTVGKTNLAIWNRFMKEFEDIFCVLRFGDDLGYKSNTLLSKQDICSHILPQYQPIINLVHSYNKPFLLHSCGNNFGIMEELIACGINAKHSNEDQIAPFSRWVLEYGDRIGNFGGIDLDVVCNASRPEMKEYITDVVKTCSHHGGFAFSTGNSIPNYVPAEGYLNMVEIVRELRGDFS